MPIQVNWDNAEKTILHFEFEGVWTWEEFEPIHKQAAEMTAGMDHTIDVIFDVEKSASKPKNLMLNMQRFSGIVPPNWGRQVIVRKGQFTKTMIYTYSRIFGKKKEPNLLHADTLEAARSLLKRA